ncbi:MAG: PHB depolymerase family esterase [Acidimicrobiales bacterium]
MTGARLAGIALTLALVAGCGGGSDDASPTTTTSVASTTSTRPVEVGSTELGPEDRPASLVAPDEVTAPAPLLLLVHGYSSDAAQQDAYLGVTEQARSRGLYVLLPDGTGEPSGKRFWDAGPACCNFTGTPVDDVAYLQGLIEEAIEARPIDPNRIYVFGHSNGGFMTYRLACELADQLTAVAVLAGADQPNDGDCRPSRPVSVLHLHGTDDGVISYDGGRITAPYPGAVETVVRWAARGRCDAEPVQGEPLDLVPDIEGAETRVTAFDGCAPGIAVQLDTIDGGGHVPRIDQSRVGGDILDWLLARAS